MIGKIVSHYRVLEEIGKGGMGVVYKAEDMKLKRIDALKFLPPGLTQDQEARGRFQREAQAAAALNHPNIVTVYDISEYENQIYIAMEYVDGLTLKEKISGKEPGDDFSRNETTPRKTEKIAYDMINDEGSVPPLTVNEIIDITIQLCQGLQKAHQAGIVHRDVKPQNILINKEGKIKILDFGVAKLKGASQLTAEFYTVGTPHYMSPEQSSGEEVDHRTDIWAVGVVLYEMLTRQLPFKGDNPNTVIYSIINKEMIPVTEVETDIPFEMEQIVNRCLEKNPKKRFQGADEIIAALEGLKERMISGKRTGKLKSVFLRYRYTSRRRFPKIAVPVAAAVLVILLILLSPAVRKTLKGWAGMGIIPDEKHIAVLPFTTAGKDHTNHEFCCGLKETVIDRLSQLEQFHRNLWVIPTHRLRRYKATNPKEARKIFEATLVITGNIKRIGNTLDLTLDLIDTKSMRKIDTWTTSDYIHNLSTFQDGVVLELARMMEIELSQEAREILHAGGTALPGAYEFYLQGKGCLEYKKDEMKVRQAIDRFQRAIGQDSSYALAHAGLGEAYWNKYNLTKEMEWAEKAIFHCKEAARINERLGAVHVTLGIIYRGINRNDEALEEFRQAIELNPQCYYGYIEMAKTYEDEKSLKEAEETYKKALKLRPGYWIGFNYLAFFYSENARYPEAINMYEMVTRITPDNPDGYRNLGVLYNFMGQSDQAAKMYEKSLSIKPNAYASSNLGTIYFFQGRYTEAAAMFEKAVNMEKSTYKMWGNLADTYRFMKGQSKKAVETYETAIKLANEQLEKNPNNAAIRSNLALYYARSGDLKRALDEISRAQKHGLDDLEVIWAAIIVFELNGQRDYALRALKEYKERYGTMEELLKEPDLSELWKDPRYKKMLK